MEDVIDHSGGGYDEDQIVVLTRRINLHQACAKNVASLHSSLITNMTLLIMKHVACAIEYRRR
jgi:hypothetical protein